jgi:hypothetical protein
MTTPRHAAVSALLAKLGSPDQTRLDAIRAWVENWRDDGYDAQRTTRPVVDRLRVDREQGDR